MTMFISYAKYNNLHFLVSEILIYVFLLLCVSLIAGLCLIVCGRFFRVLTIEVLLLLFLLSQIHLNAPISVLWPRFSNYTIDLIIIAALYPFILFFENKKLDIFLIIFFSMTCVGTIFIHHAKFINEKTFITKNKQNNTLPPYIELVLDEHIGMRGFLSFHNQNTLYQNIRDKYIHRGFRVYDEAYSQKNRTIQSFNIFLNFNSVKSLDNGIYVNGDANKVIKNKLFESLSKKGYLINVIQSSYLDLCSQEKNTNLAKCITYQIYDHEKTNHPQYIKQKIMSIIAPIITMVHLRGLYQHIITLPLISKLNLSSIWLNQFTRPSAPSAGYHVFPKVMRLIKTVQPGNAYFIHILLPHLPFIFDAKCNYTPTIKNEADAYFNQVQCAQSLVDKFLQEIDANPDAKNATIVIHGDHGVRINPIEPDSNDFLASKNNIQNFSTFFVVRSPLYKPGYDPSRLPIDVLLKNLLQKVLNDKSYKKL